MTQSAFAFEFRAFDAEEFFVKRLADHRRAIHAGITDPATRKERIRAAIIQGGLECVCIGRHPQSKKAESYAELFQRHYGEPLTSKTAKSKEKRHVQTAI